MPASYALLGDVNIAEPGAFIGFAGPRVIEQATKKKLPADVNTAEFMLAHGMVECVVPRAELRETLSDAAAPVDGANLPTGCWGWTTPPCASPPARHGRTGIMANRLEFEERLARLEDDLALAQYEADNGNEDATAAKWRRWKIAWTQETVELYAGLTPWQKVQVARHPERPYTLDYLRWAFTDFVELHGDRRFGDDGAIVGGPALLDGRAVMVVGHQNGRGTRENVQRNFGMPHPEGLRKAQRLFSMAESLALPVVTLCGYTGRLGQHRRRGARPGRGDRQSIASDGRVARAHRVGRHRPGQQRRRAGHRRWPNHLDAGACVLLRRGARSGGRHHVALGDACAGGRRRDGHHGAGLLAGGVVDGIIPEPPGGAHRDQARGG